MNKKIMNEKEIRTLHDDIEIRSDDSESTKIVGYALKFNVESDNLGGFVERIDRHALDKADMSDVRALVNHSADKVLGRTKSGTLKLDVDDIGLRYTIIPPDTSYANDLIKSMKRQDINQSSFAFMIDYANNGSDWEYNEDRDLYIRTIKRFKKILDVSIVTYAAYSQTESVVAERGLEAFKQELETEIKKRKLFIELELL